MNMLCVCGKGLLIVIRNNNKRVESNCFVQFTDFEMFVCLFVGCLLLVFGVEVQVYNNLLETRRR